MTEPRGYPFGLDADRLIDLVSTCWRSHDGQWFLKVAARVGLEEAMRLNERAIASLARIELREFKRVTGTESLDTIDEVADWYRLSWYIFGGLERPQRRLSVVDADTLVVENAQCFGEPIAERSGYGHLRPGEYPPCLGWLERQRAWGDALSRRYRFTVDREPGEGRPCRYVVRRSAAHSAPSPFQGEGWGEGG
ncbi:MAG TPA: DUF6125 family protein [Methylomirabilota bacterium]|jgi:hypothetical protein|nr:DUF6125 family protein [Methylomirabilota bacterium]